MSDPVSASEPQNSDLQGLRLVVGLGNPGSNYQGSRHNVGFDALDLLARRLGASPAPFPAQGSSVGRLWQSPEATFAFLWPTLFMNRCGIAVAQALQELAMTPASMLVVTDDYHLLLGALRLRSEGSSGGHNGLLSIEESCQTRSFPRLRIGVGDPGSDSVDFVLSPFRRAEEAVIEETRMTASWALEDWIRGSSLEELQTRYNRRSPQAESAQDELQG